MKTSDLELEEEILSLMLTKHMKHGLGELLEEDFVGFSESVQPHRYTRYIFQKICEHVLTNNVPSIHVLKKSIQAELDMSDASKDVYNCVLERLYEMEHSTLEIEYFHLACQELKGYTDKRKLSTFSTEYKKSIEADSITGVKEAMQKYQDDTARFSHKLDSITIIDYKTHYEERKNKLLSKDVSDSIIMTGQAPIDINGGLRGGDLIVILSRTSGGKSVWKQDIAGSLVELDRRVGYFSKEDSAEAVAYRLDSRFTGISHLDFRRRKLTEKDYKNWEGTMKIILDNTLKIICMGQNFCTKEVSKICGQLYNTGFEPEVLFLDYIGIMKPSSSKDGGSAKWEKMDNVVREIKELAVEMDIPIITSAQIKPEAYQEESLSIEDIAYGKLAVSSHADHIFGLIRTDAMQAIDLGRIQHLKGRGGGIIQEFWDITPQMNILKVHTGGWGDKLKKHMV
jgi:replicative DNA helicase